MSGGFVGRPATDLGHEIRVEIQGAMGAEDKLSSQEIDEADAVIIVADTLVNRDRFEGKPLEKAQSKRQLMTPNRS